MKAFSYIRCFRRIIFTNKIDNKEKVFHRQKLTAIMMEMELMLYRIGNRR